jgi:FMN-dependent NADH-azoreductase
MATLLHLSSSAQAADRSITRQPRSHFRRRWDRLLPEGRIFERDLAEAPVPPVTAAWIEAAFTPPGRRTAGMREVLSLSDLLIDEISSRT